MVRKVLIKLYVYFFQKIKHIFSLYSKEDVAFKDIENVGIVIPIVYQATKITSTVIPIVIEKRIVYKNSQSNIDAISPVVNKNSYSKMIDPKINPIVIKKNPGKIFFD